MKDTLKNIQSIITRVFDREYFYDFGFQPTVFKVQQEISLFEEKYPNMQMSLYNVLKEKFPNAYIENMTQLFNYDRCLRMLVEIDKDLRFVAQVSIFNYFSIYQHPVDFINSRYEYGDLMFVSKDESEICNLIYGCANDLLKDNLMWLERDVLLEVIKDFSVLAEDKKFSYEIKIVDALFTKIYVQS